jgi:hypothetical protein
VEDEKVETSRALPGGPRIRSGCSRQSDPVAAVQELAAAIKQPDMGLVIVFAASSFNLDRLAAALGDCFAPATVVGCTTAGEIGPEGYLEGGLSAVSIHSDDITFEVGLLDSLFHFESDAGRKFAQTLKEALYRRVPDLAPENTFAFMLIDGLCGREEVVSRAFYDGLGGIALIGGSAGDNQAFAETRILYDGHFVSDAAILLVATTPFLFDVFKTQHFVSGNERMVVTAAIPEKRIVTEINGCPAAEEYARAIGLELDQLDAMVFSAYPVVVRIGNADFVRSIQKMNPDGSLTFFCAIDNGIVFKIAQGIDMIDNLTAALEAVRKRVGQPALILGCDCILRQLESKQRGTRDRMGKLMAGCNVLGFSTYGEQYRGMHINQTFTGIAIGSERRR